MCTSSPYNECLHCGISFTPVRKGHNYCAKKCAQKACRTANPEKQRAQKRAWYKANRTGELDKVFQRTYGITLEERNDMFAGQDGRCAICDGHMTLEGRKKDSAHVDHCHTTGEVYSLLCNGCNTGLGSLGENPVILAKAIQYLTETGKVPTR